MTIFSTGTGISAIRGSVGGNTYRTIGIVVIGSKKKKKGKKTKPIKPPPLTGAALVWSNMNQSDRVSWNAAAAASPLPVGSFTSGYNLFLAYWAATVFYGNAMTPGYPSTIPANQNYDPSITSNSYALSDLTLTLANATTSNNWLKIDCEIEIKKGSPFTIYTTALAYIELIQSAGVSSINLFSDLYAVDFYFSPGDIIYLYCRMYGTNGSEIEVWYDYAPITVVLGT